MSTPSVASLAASLGRRAGSVLRRIDLAPLRLFLRLVPDEPNRIFAVIVVIGGLCGVAAVLFHLSIRFVEKLLIERALAAEGYSWVPWTIATPTLGALACGVLLHKLVPAARGSGVPQVKVVFAAKSGRLRFRDALGKFAIGVLQLGTGSSLGREGPTVQICAGLASGVGRLAAVSPQNLRRLLAVGAAAGIAAAFNAPIAAVTFTIEEIVGDLDHTVLSGVVVAAAMAAVIERSVLGEHPVFEVSQHYGLDHASSLVVYAILGVAAAGASILFRGGLLRLRKSFSAWSSMPPWARPAVGGLVTGVLAVVALSTLNARGVTGGGYATLSQALDGKLALQVMIALCMLKLVATVFAYASGGSGGVFAPVLFVGAMLGGSIGYLDRFVLGHTSGSVGAFALVGMGAVFAGTIRAPITSVLIIFEMTGGYGLVLPLMIANTISYLLARRAAPTPLYEALIEQDGIHLPRREQLTQAIAELFVIDAMTTEVVTLPDAISVRDAVRRTGKHTFAAYPVLDEQGRYVGLVNEARLRRRLAAGAGDSLVRDHVRLRDYLHPDQALVHAVMRMNRIGVHQLVVVDREDPQRLRGILSMSDVLRAHAQAAVQAGERESMVLDEVLGRPSQPPAVPPARRPSGGADAPAAEPTGRVRRAR